MSAKNNINFILCIVILRYGLFLIRKNLINHITIPVYFADLVVKKIFILKLAYAFIFWVLIHKAGYFLTWFASYLKEQKHHQHEHHDYHGPPHDYEPSYAPYRRQGGLI